MRQVVALFCTLSAKKRRLQSAMHILLPIVHRNLNHCESSRLLLFGAADFTVKFSLKEVIKFQLT